MGIRSGCTAVSLPVCVLINDCSGDLLHVLFSQLGHNTFFGFFALVFDGLVSIGYQHHGFAER